MVLSARRGNDTDARKALEQLCQTYWYPLYAFVRRRGHSVEDAQDLTQAFFARLLEKDYLANVDRAKGRFRSFLLASLKHFLSNEWDRAGAQKRGGRRSLIPLDGPAAESHYALEPADNITPENLYERRWALTLLEATLARLRDEFAGEGKSRSFDELKFALVGDKGSVGYAELARQLGMSEGALKVAVHRLRARYRAVLRAQVADTVGEAGDVEEELRHLFEVLGSV